MKESQEGDMSRGSREGRQRLEGKGEELKMFPDGLEELLGSYRERFGGVSSLTKKVHGRQGNCCA